MGQDNTQTGLSLHDTVIHFELKRFIRYIKAALFLADPDRALREGQSSDRYLDAKKTYSGHF